MEPSFLTEHEAAELLRISPRTLQRWRLTGDGPVFVRAGRRVLYQPTELEAFLEVSKARSTSEYGNEAA